MNAINTAKQALVSALDAAGYGFTQYITQYNGPLGAPGTIQVFAYPIPAAPKPAAGQAAAPVSGAEKIALIQALESSYNVGLQDAQVWDEVSLAVVPGLILTLTPIAQ